MRPIVAVVVIVVALMGGCAKPRTTRAAGLVSVTLGGTAAVVGGLMYVLSGFAGHCQTDCGDDGAELARQGTLVGISGLVAIVVGGVIYIAASGDGPAPDHEPAPRDQRRAPIDHERALAARARDRAWSLTKQAEQSARAGNCAVVAGHDYEVRQLDPEFHPKVFVRDVGIKRCLDAINAAGKQPEVSP